MVKVVIHVGYGGFSITRKAAEFMAARGNARAKKEIEETDAYKNMWYGFGYVGDMGGTYDRTDPDLIAAVCELGEAAGRNLKVVDVPDGVEWYIHEYDGCESIHERHRVWD